MVAKRRCSLPRCLLIFGASALGCSTGWAAGGAHEHGAAELLLSAEGKDVEINVNLPAQSLVGFETAAISEEQRTAVKRARASLMVPSNLFILVGNTCTLVAATVDVTSILGMSETHSQAEGHSDHDDEVGHSDHDEGLDHSDHHEEQEEVSATRNHESHDHDTPATSHSDIAATYTFNCERNDALTKITFGQDELPFGLERIDVFWVADWGQGTGQATPQDLDVDLRD